MERAIRGRTFRCNADPQNPEPALAGDWDRPMKRRIDQDSAGCHH